MKPFSTLAAVLKLPSELQHHFLKIINIDCCGILSQHGGQGVVRRHCTHYRGKRLPLFHHEHLLTWLFQAASGIGKETALSFAEAGAKGVALADINEEGALAAAEESKKCAKDASFKAIAVKVDITDETSVDNMVQTALKEFGRIDYSVNSAGVCHSPRMFSMLSITNARILPDGQPLWCDDPKHQSRHVLSHP